MLHYFDCVLYNMEQNSKVGLKLYNKNCSFYFNTVLHIITNQWIEISSKI